MSDEELVKRLRSCAFTGVSNQQVVYVDKSALEQAAAAIEALTAERDEALNQLDSARHSVDVLEKRVAFVEGERRKTFQALLKVTKIHDDVEAKLATCEKYRDAYAECDRIGTQAVRDLENKLTKAHEKEIAVWSENYAAMERKLEAARADTKKAVEALRGDPWIIGWKKWHGRASAIIAEIEGETG